MNVLNAFLFVAFPYVAVIIFVVGVIYRRRQKGFTVSSLSSQFLEGGRLFWGSVPFHVGLLVVLLEHLILFLLPDTVVAWNRVPLRLITLEVTVFIFGVSVVTGLVALLYRRLTNRRVRAVTTPMDVAIELLLLLQVLLGCFIALRYRWGSSWFPASLSPYLWSLVKLAPDTAAVTALPVFIRLHIVGAFVIVLMVPFTRLVHFVVAPLNYLVRPYQLVRWNWDRKTIRNPATVRSATRPRNR
jgi:nitrate reductase gamma subunit